MLFRFESWRTSFVIQYKRRVDMKNRILLLIPSVVLIAAIAGGWFDGS